MAFNIAVIAGAMGAPTRLISVGASLLIAPSFLVLTASLHSIVQEDKKMWTLIGFAFAIVYTTLAGFNYFLQLTVVRQNPPAYGWLTMNFSSDTAFWALEVLLYSFQGLAALFVIPVFAGREFGRSIGGLLSANGVFTVLGALAYLLTGNPLHPLVLASLAVYAIAFPAAMTLSALMFKRTESVNV